MSEKIALEMIMQQVLNKNIEYIKTGEGKIHLLDVNEITDILRKSEEIIDDKA